MAGKNCFKRVSVNKAGFISSSISVVGTLHLLLPKYKAIVSSKIGATSNLMAFKCINFLNKLIQSKVYNRSNKRSNYTVSFTFKNKVMFGNVEVFIMCNRKCPSSTFCHEMCICKNTFYGAIIETLKPVNDISFDTQIQSVNKLSLQHIDASCKREL